MSLNNGTESTWGDDNKGPDNQAPQSGNAAPLDGLAGLLRLSSMTSDNRNVKEVAETIEKLTQIYDNAKKSTTNELQRKIIPVVESLTSNISPNLPGVGLYMIFNGTMYVMAALFYNRTMNIGSERITINTNQMSQQMSTPLTPAQYPNQQFLEKLTGHYQKVAQQNGVKNLAVINMIVLDLEMLNHPEAGEQKDWGHILANSISSEWEEAVLVKTVRESVAAGYALPNPFATPDAPYGKDGCAEARVNAVSFRTSKAKTLTPDNMEVIVSTINNNSNSTNFQNNSKEIVRASAAVSLNGVSWEDYVRFVASHRTPDQMNALQNFMGAGMGVSPYPNGFRPLRPVITIGNCVAGEQLSNNGGLFPIFYSLYALMTTNNQFVFSEALRRHSVGARGNLAALETRIDQMLGQIPGGAAVQSRIILNDKNIGDTELVNQWIRQNVSPHATFQINLIPAGPGASINNFFAQLAKHGQNAAELKVVIAMVDAMTKNKMSEIIRRNAAAGGTGWTPSKPILLPTGMIVINGLAEFGGKKLNTQELDEMMISNIKGPKGKAAIESLLSTMYGTIPGEEYKQRAQKLRVEASSSVFDGQVHINGFAQPHIWAPDFMAVLAEAMDSIGQLNVANNLGSWRNTALASTPGIGLATYTAAGSNNPNGAGLGSAYNMGIPFM